MSRTALVLWNREPENDDELPLKRNDVIEILKDNVFDGWMEGRLANGTTGLFPDNFVKLQPPTADSKRIPSTLPPPYRKTSAPAILSPVPSIIGESVAPGYSDGVPSQLASSQSTNSLVRDVQSISRAPSNDSCAQPNGPEGNTGSSGDKVPDPPAPSSPVGNVVPESFSQQNVTPERSTAGAVYFTHTLKSFEYRKSGPLDRVIDVTAALEVLKLQGLEQQEWFHVFTALTLLNDLLRNPIQPENELNGALAALTNSLNQKPGKGRLRFVSKVQRKNSLLKADKQITSIDVMFDRSAAPGNEAVVDSSTAAQQLQKIALQEAAIAALEAELAEANSEKKGSKAVAIAEAHSLRLKVQALEGELAARKNQDGVSESLKSQMKRLLAQNAELNEKIKCLETELQESKQAGSSNVAELQKENGLMREKLSAMEKGRSLLAKRVEELEAAIENAETAELSNQDEELVSEVARLTTSAEEAKTIQAALTDRVKALEKALRVELKSTADLSNKLQNALREKKDLKEMLEQTLGGSVGESQKQGSRRSSPGTIDITAF